MRFHEGRQSIVQLLWWLSFLFLLATASSNRAEDEALDSVMYHAPELPKAKIARALPPDLISDWLVALRRPEADYQCRAALTIVRAHQEGMKDLERTIHPLLEILEQPLAAPPAPPRPAPPPAEPRHDGLAV